MNEELDNYGAVVNTGPAKTVTRFASATSSPIQPHPDAPDGTVTTLARYSKSTFLPSDVVLCRNTAPLIDLAFTMLRHGVACHILGRDIQAGLEKLLDSVWKGNKNETQIALMAYSDKESAKLVRKGKRDAADNLVDRCTVLSIFIDKTVGDLNAIKATIAKLFADGPGVTLCTIHKSKGLEFPRVFLLDRHLIPSRWAESDHELQQEKNLMYVAVTRAKVDLTYIESGRWAA